MKMFVLASLLFAAGCCHATSWVRVHLPEPGYRKADGTLLKFTEFKKTTVIYGTCSVQTGIGEELGREDVRSWGFTTAVFEIPSDKPVCFIAVVVGLDDQPMGRSNVAVFPTPTGEKRPKQVVDVKVQVST